MNVKPILAIILLTLISCSSKKENIKPPSQPFPVITVEQRDVVGYKEYPARIQGSNNNEVRAKISGYIEKLYVDEGQFVQRGQPLFKLETNVISQAANAAQSGATAAQANIISAQAVVDAAQVEVDKLTPLVQKNIVSGAQLETAKANLQRSRSGLEQARANYEQAKANYLGAAANVGYAIVRSPISGVVGKITKREGSLVGPADITPFTVISDVKQLYAYFSMNERDYLDFLEKSPGKNIAEKLARAPAPALILANNQKYPENGKLQTVTGQIDPAAGTIQFRILFPNSNGLLTNGNSGVVRIPTEYKNAIVIPQTAITEQQGVNYIYSVEDGDIANERIVKLIAKFDGIAVVESGLALGKRIVADGAGNLKTGVKIKPEPISVDSALNSIKPIFE